MRVAVLVEGWPGESRSLTAEAVAQTVRTAWLSARPDVTVTAIPVGDGGPRSADALQGPRITVGGAEATVVEGAMLLAPAGGSTRWNPADLATALLGLASEASADGGPARRVIVPLGDASPAGDAGDVWGQSLEGARTALAPLDMVALVSSDRPLLGFHGMSAAVREGRESDAALAVAAQEQEERWRQRAAVADNVAAAGDLLGGTRRLSDQPRTGAAGGLAYALAALGARLEPGAVTLARMAGLPAAVDEADLAVVVAPTLSHAALDHGTPSPVALLAAARGIPAVAISAEIHVGRRDLMAAGIHGAHEGMPGESGLADAITRVAQTWSS